MRSYADRSTMYIMEFQKGDIIISPDKKKYFVLGVCEPDYYLIGKKENDSGEEWEIMRTFGYRLFSRIS